MTEKTPGEIRGMAETAIAAGNGIPALRVRLTDAEIGSAMGRRDLASEAYQQIDIEEWQDRAIGDALDDSSALADEALERGKEIASLKNAASAAAELGAEGIARAMRERDAEAAKFQQMEASLRSLSLRVRPGFEAAPWVVEEITKILAALHTPLNTEGEDRRRLCRPCEGTGLSWVIDHMETCFGCKGTGTRPVSNTGGTP